MAFGRMQIEALGRRSTKDETVSGMRALLPCIINECRTLGLVLEHYAALMREYGISPEELGYTQEVLDAALLEGRKAAVVEKLDELRCPATPVDEQKELLDEIDVLLKDIGDEQSLSDELRTELAAFRNRLTGK